MLDVRDLSVSYGQHRALEGVSIHVGAGEIVVILGANGAGKSTLLRTISGICEGRHSGSVDMDGHAILGLNSDKIVERGIALVPEGRGIFGDLTVRENLVLGAYSARARDDETANLDRILSLFPKLAERQAQTARTMSGGEQQMVAIGRAMMSNPAILMLDEPSLGLSPLLCKELFQSLTEIRRTGIGILLVEQNAKQSLAIADRGYLLENAHIVHEDTAERLARDPAVQKAYLGAGSAAAPKPAPKVAAPAPAAEPEAAPRSIPAMPVTGGAARPASADALAGGSIDDLVARASASAPPPTAVPAPKPSAAAASPADAAPATRSSHDERLRAALEKIEQAAADAMARRSRTRRAPGTAKTDKPAAAKPAIVEVYRAPRVEVYRRRPGSGEFERD